MLLAVQYLGVETRAAAKPPRIAAPATPGVNWGYISTAEGLIGRMKSEIGKTLTVITTGGLTALFQNQAHPLRFDSQRGVGA